MSVWVVESVFEKIAALGWEAVHHGKEEGEGSRTGFWKPAD